MPTPEGRSVTQLAEVLASLGASSTAAAARQAGLVRIAEGFKADAALLVERGDIDGSFGFDIDEEIPADFVALAAGESGKVHIAGAGHCNVVIVNVPVEGSCRMLL